MKIITLVVEDGHANGVEHFLVNANNGFASGMLVSAVKVEDVQRTSNETFYVVARDGEYGSHSSSGHYDTADEAVALLKDDEYVERVVIRSVNGAIFTKRVKVVTR
jgi:hypothetical protein